MSHHIVIALDGTGREGKRGFEVEKNTNVYRTKICIDNGDKAGIHSLYIPGVGTKGWRGRRLFDQVTGSGTDSRILKAYRFICDNYLSEADNIYLIGYSRGAFAARCVADLVFKIGILASADSHGGVMDEIFERWKSGDENPRGGFNPVPVSEGKRVKICVLWDTVAKVVGALPRVVDSNVRGADYNFQALAMHERRGDYLPIVMRFPGRPSPRESEPPIESEQCWFNGYHGDIGGGRAGNALGNISLAWALAKLHDDLRPNWAPLQDETPQRTWKWYGNKLKLDIRDTAKGVYGARIRNRYPKRQFWNSKTPSTLPVNRETYDINSRETFHSTLRYLSEYIPEKPRGLRGAVRPVPPGRHWELYKEDWFRVDEAVMLQTEGEGLRGWLDSSIRQLQLLPVLGQPSPRTVIAQLKAELSFKSK
ncbi:hypothetical protein GGR51DRAFT_530382 [Nemania sp. FL0031]|nr:hypothetical protein GGR51DRAFT_530382 [Nemania sp. FL0031]